MITECGACRAATPRTGEKYSDPGENDATSVRVATSSRLVYGFIVQLIIRYKGMSPPAFCAIFCS